MRSYSIPIPIRYRDIDMNHHVNNAVYFTYMENARAHVLMQDLIKHHAQGLQFVVAEANCKYKRPIKLDDELECEVSFHPLRPTSYEIRYHFKHALSGEPFAEGMTRMVLFNESTGRPLVLPDWFVEKYLSP